MSSTITKNIINSSLKKEAPNVLILNAKSSEELVDFYFNIFTFEQFSGAITVTQDQLSFLDIDYIVNLRPFDDNFKNIYQFVMAAKYKMYNYIIEIGKMKPEAILFKSRNLEQFVNVFEKQEDLDKTHLSGQVINRLKFSELLKHE